jgi:tetratricopeptide (TPR) repeat protein
MEDTPMEPADASDEEMPAMETVPVENNNDAATAASAPSVNDVDDIPEPPPLMESTATGAPDQTAKKDSSDDDDDTLSIDSRESDVDFKGDPMEILVRATTLKEEGNAQFKEGDLSKACRSYRKGTNLLKPLNKNNTGDDQVKALLISLLNNHAMVLFRLKQYKTSRNVATHALQVDGENVKALYRRAVAQRKLGDVKEARDDLKQALKYDANNVAVRKELVSIKKQLEDSTAKEKKQLQKAFSKKSGSSFLYDDKEEEERKKEEAMKQKKQQEQEALEKRKVEWEDECVKRMAQGEEAISFEDWEKERKKKEKALEKARKEEERIKREAAIKARTPPGGSSESVVIDSDDELTEKELAMLRGYKKTSDGRTTSYFHRELSEEEKKLLGTNAPKKIEQATAAQRPASITPSAEAGKGQASAWNQAGTWEEKNTSEWCNGHLRTKLSSATAELDNGAHVGVVTKVDSLTGDASVAVVSGKKRYIFDYHASLQYEIRDESVDEVIASGSFKLPDINSASHDELEVDVPSWSKPPTPAMEMNAMQCRSLLIDSVRNAVQDFVNDFNAHY